MKEDTTTEESSASATDADVAEMLDADKPTDTSIDEDATEVDTEDVLAEADEATAKTPVEQPKRSKKKPVLLALVLIAVALVGAAVYWFVIRDASPKACCAQPIEQQNAQEAPAADEVLQRFTKPTTGETWLAEPKPIPKQGYLQYEDEYTSYYEVGARAGNRIVMSTSCGMGCDSRLFEVAPSGTVTFISRPDSQATYNTDEEQYDQFITASVVINKTQTYDSLSIPRSLPIDDTYNATKPSYNSLGEFITADNEDKDAKLTDKKTYGQSKVIESERSYTDTGLTSIGYAVKLPINTYVWMTIQPTTLDLNGYQWNSGYSVNDKIKAIARGCGGANASLTRSDALKAADVRAVGKNPDGVDVYELADANNSLLTKAYDEFKQYVKTDDSVPYHDISKEEFVKEHGLVIVKDKYGQYLVYVREQLSPAYGCAKPVVYLYPTTTTSVNVQVGADVKVSDPLYPVATGWQNVLAQPNGQLTYHGQQYDSLFWEGPGYGQYPAVVSGTVVKRSDAVSTIRLQLAQQGLNQREIDDFVEYWQDKLPNKPYVRLTWFTTAQLNQLAPLHITPKPATVIRVFLDFAGLDAPINIPTQQLTAIPRQGFTVVEWGGLSPSKLY